MKGASGELRTLFDAGTMVGLSDGGLLERFGADREEAAFEALVRRHGPMVWGVCRRVLRDHHDAEDAFQATFLVLARRGPALADREQVAGWLHGVAYRTAVKARATRARKRGRETTVAEMPEPESPSARGDDRADWLDRELGRLPEKYRMPIVLCELEGKSHREAAEQLGWPVGTVSGRLSRARAMLARRSSGAGSLASVAIRWTSEGPPARLVAATVGSARWFAAGRSAAAGVVSAEVAAMAEGVLRTMWLDKMKLATAGLVVVVSLAAGGIGMVYRAGADDGPGRPEPAAVAPKPDRPDPSLLARAEAEQKPSGGREAYAFNIDAENVRDFPALSIDFLGLQIKGGPMTVVPMETAKGIAGAMLIGDGTFHYAPKGGPTIEGHFRAAMLRFNPEDQAKLLPLEKGKRITDRAAAEMSKHMLGVVVRHCWQSGGNLLIPPTGTLAADLYSKEHGDLLISGDERTAVVYNFTERKVLYEKK